MKSIFLYCDEGVCPSSVRETARSLREYLDPGKYKIELAKRGLFLEDGWENRAAMVIFPGGRDIAYLQALQGAANRRIREYVLCGGRYFGICAGAYYGSGSISFEPGGSLEVIGERELSFFPGCAYGPALGLGQFSPKNSQGARFTSLALSSSNFPIINANAYYHGGCTFLQATSFPGVRILAEYKELQGNSPAIVLCNAGNGKALLSGIHPEYQEPDCSDEKANQKKLLFSWLIEILLK